MKAKKVLSVLMVMALAASMAACSGGSTTETTAAADGTAAASGETAAQSSDGKTVVEFFNQKTEIVDILETLIAEYEADHPDVDIQLTTPADATTVLTSRMASDDTPDVFTMWPSATFFSEVDSGYVMDLSSTGIMDNVQEAAREQWKHNDGEYAATISYNCSGIWYNVDIFNECGITEVPSTWDELMADCEILKSNGYTPFATVGKAVDVTDRHLQVFLASSMGDTYEEFEADAGNGEVDVTKDYGEALKAMGEKMTKILEYSQDDVIGADQDSVTANFANGEGAMMIGGSWLLASATSANPDINMSMMPIPGDTADQTNTCAYPGDMSLCIAENSDVQDAAVEFVKWFTSPEIATEYAEMEGNPSCIIGVDTIADQFKDLYDNYVTTGKFILNPDCSWSSSQQNAAGSAVQQLYYDGDYEAFPELLQEAFNEN